MAMDIAYVDRMIGAAAAAAALGYFSYRRFRRNLGRQSLRRGALLFRLAVFAAVTLLMLVFSLKTAPAAVAALAGFAAGALTASRSAKYTRFEKRGEELFYIPHTWAGVAISALFLARVLYRLAERYGAPVGTQAPALAAAQGAVTASPLTLFIFCVLCGYYIYFYSYLLKKSSSLGPEDWEKPGVPAAEKN